MYQTEASKMDVVTVINEEALRETKKYLVPHNMKTILKVFEVFYIVVAVIAFLFYGQVIIAGLFFCLSILMIGIYKFSENKMVKLNLKCLKNLTENDNVKSKITFLEDRALFYGVTGKMQEILFAEFMIFGETENYYVLYTRNLTGGIIEKTSLDESSKVRFLEIVDKTPAGKKANVK